MDIVAGRGDGARASRDDSYRQYLALDVAVVFQIADAEANAEHSMIVRAAYPLCVLPDSFPDPRLCTLHGPFTVPRAV